MGELPVLNVDPDLLQFSLNVSTTVRDLSNQAKITNQQNQVIQHNTYDTMVMSQNQHYVGGYGWGYGFSTPSKNWESNRPQMEYLMAAGNMSESARRNETWKNINTETAKMKQAMTAKYNVEF
jgi:hypothetical protein